MSLTPCPECGMQVSSRASICPHCGNQIQRTFRQRYNRAGLIVLGVLLAFAVGCTVIVQSGGP